MSNTIHGVSLSEYAAAIGALTTQAIDNNAILNALNITSEQWTEVCTKYQFAALQNMGTYMQYYSNPALCPKFSYLAGDEKIDTNSEANSAFSQLMNNFQDYLAVVMTMMKMTISKTLNLYLITKKNCFLLVL